jgi:CO/xanthine dehydrogenase FAD-binding subunit
MQSSKILCWLRVPAKPGARRSGSRPHLAARVRAGGLTSYSLRRLDTPMNGHFVAASLPDALAALAAAVSAGEPAIPLAGATDLYPAEATRRAWFGARTGSIIDISRISDMSGIAVGSDEVVLGAMTSWTAIAEAALPPAFAALQAAARQVGGRQIQNRGTIGGNLCNASPAADGAPPLLALDAQVELVSAVGARRMPLSEFLLGNRTTARRTDELLTRVIIPHPAIDERSVFLKLGARSYLVISIASLAANLRFGPDGSVMSARIALGACSAVPTRLHRIERMLLGRRIGDVAISLGPEDGLSPIDDIRASASYRRRAAEILVRRGLTACAAPVPKAA